MKSCKVCKTENDDNSKFCKNCKKPLKETEKAFRLDKSSNSNFFEKEYVKFKIP